MNSLFSKFASFFAGQSFLSAQYFRDPLISTKQFNLALKNARTYFEKHKEQKIAPELIHESWLHNITTLESYFSGQMNEDFLSNEVINGTMVFTNRKAHKVELGNISRVFDTNIAAQVISKGLNSTLIDGKSRRGTLINSTHHLHHLMRFEQSTGRKIIEFDSVVEFGGGYGNMARVVSNFGACKRYAIVDLLLFSCIQYAFLSTVSDIDQVIFDDDNLQNDAKFILHPLFCADAPASLHGKLFISTWALSESTRATYEWVLACNWFGASNLLLAYNEQWKPWSDGSLEESLTDNGWHVVKEAIPFLPGSFYLFATR